MILLFFLLVFSIPESLSLWCVDGTDCDHECGICEGAACLRIQGPHPTRHLSIATTCLPHDSLIHLHHPEGCRTDLTTGKKTCLCSDYDFCNLSPIVFSTYILCAMIMLNLM